MLTHLIRAFHFCLALSATIFCDFVFAFEPFQATYQVDYNNKPLGTATSSLQQLDENTWNYSFSANAGEFIKASSQSIFHLEDGSIQPSNFTRSTKLFFFNSNNDIQFDLINKKIIAKNDKTNKSYPLEDHVYDELSAELQIREDLKNQQLKAEYLIADIKGIKSLQLTQEGLETVITNSGTYDTLKLLMKHDDTGRQTTFWLAPSLDYIPVKAMHIDDNLSYSLLLNSYKKTKTD